MDKIFTKQQVLQLINNFYGSPMYQGEDLKKIENVIDTYGIEKTINLIIIFDYHHADPASNLIMHINNNDIDRLFSVVPEQLPLPDKFKKSKNFVLDKLLQM